MKYKLNVARDVDTDEPDVFILNLPNGWRFDDGGSFNANDASHVQGFDTMKELRAAVKNEVIVCACNGCKFKAVAGRKVAFNYNAPYNPEFLGAQPARTGEDY